MGTPSLPKKVKLIVGLISGDERYRDKARSSLSRIFGRIDYESGLLDFAATTYYNEELGEGLKRKFISFERLVRLDGIARTKLVTNALERRLSRSGKRLVNIDPGYVDLSKLVLLTTKDRSHRVYLAKGIYGEVALYFKGHTFNPWEWTYPDYKTKEHIDIFTTIRNLYKGCLKNVH
jgi:hypothetical protein